MKSDKIYGTKERYAQNYSDINRNISTHIAQTAMNTYLPEGYIESVKIGKPDHWVYVQFAQYKPFENGGSLTA